MISFIRDILIQSGRIARRDWPVLLAACLLFCIIELLFPGGSYDSDLGWSNLLISPLLYIFASALFSTLYIPMLFAGATRRAVWSDLGPYLPMLGVTALYLLICFGALLLFILPVFYFGPIFALSHSILIGENSSIDDSFRRSKSLIKGHFWPCLFTWLVPFAPLIGLEFLLSSLLFPQDSSPAASFLLAGIFTGLMFYLSTIIAFCLYRRLA